MRDQFSVSRRAVLAAVAAALVVPHRMLMGDDRQKRDLRTRLNHVYIVLDEESWMQIRNGSMLEALGAVDAGLPKFRPATASDHVLYVRGVHTYLEIMGPQNRFGEPVGRVGIGLSVDVPDDLDALENLLRPTCTVERVHQEVTWDVESPQPWMDTLWFPCFEGASVAVWVSAYHPEFVRWLSSGKRHGTRREDFLSSVYDPGKPLVDLRRIEFPVGGDQKKCLDHILRSTAWEADRASGWGNGETTIRTSGRAEVNAGAVTVGMDLQRPVAASHAGRVSLLPRSRNGSEHSLDFQQR